jgi:hypothetical protein
MNLTKHTWAIALAAISFSTGSVAMASGQDAANRQLQSSSASHASARTIRGVWRTAVTPYNCATGQPIVTLSGLFTFNQGGTMSEYGIGPGSSPALRSPGHGLWQREHGWQDYSFAFTFYRYSTSGVLLGSQKVTAALELAGNGDSFASRSRIEILDANDDLVGVGCANSVGTRFE